MVKYIGEEPKSLDAFPKILDHQKKVFGDPRMQSYFQAKIGA
jgi:hypothetical protein